MHQVFGDQELRIQVIEYDQEDIIRDNKGDCMIAHTEIPQSRKEYQVGQCKKTDPCCHMRYCRNQFLFMMDRRQLTDFLILYSFKFNQVA